MTNRKRSKRAHSLPLVMAAVSSLSIGGLASAEIVIDGFSSAVVRTPWLPTQTALGTDWVYDTGLGDAIGGTRLTTIGVWDLVNPGVDQITATINPSTNSVGYQSTPGAVGGLAMAYDNAGAGLNLDLSTESGLQVAFSDVTLGAGTVEGFFKVTALISDGVTSAIASTLVTTSGAQTVTLNFADFSNINLIDITKIDQVAVGFDPVYGSSFTVGGINTVVPTPGILACFGVSAVCGLRRRRRH